MSQSFDTAALRRRYESLTDDALLAIDRDELVEAAQAWWDAEVIERRLAIQLPGCEARPVPEEYVPPDYSRSIDSKVLRQRYASMTDDALLAIDRQFLVEAARACWDAEVIERRLAVALPVPEPPPVIEEPAPVPHWNPPQGKRGAILGFLGHAAIAWFVVGELIPWVAWSPGSIDPAIRTDVLNAVFALIVGYFAASLWPSPAARWLWIAGAVWLGVGVISGAALFPEFFPLEGWDRLAILIDPKHGLERMVYTLTGIRLCFYSLGAWSFAWFPFRPLRNLRLRNPMPRTRQPHRVLPVRIVIVLLAFLAQCAIMLASALVATPIASFTTLLLWDGDANLGALNLATALAAVMVGFAAHWRWPSRLALWVWIPGVFWFATYVAARGSLPADLSMSYSPEADDLIVTSWLLYTSILIRAVFYSFGAWVHSVLRSGPPPDTLTQEAT